MSSRFEPNPDAWPQIELRLVIAVEQWGAQTLDVMRANVHVETGGLQESLALAPTSHGLDSVAVSFHDGPARDGRVYGAAEELVRGGEHAFMRPSVDQTIGNLGKFISLAFGQPEIGSGFPGEVAWPAPHGTWNPQTGTKTYTY